MSDVKFDVGERVILELEDGKKAGRVTARIRNKYRNIKTDAGHFIKEIHIDKLSYAKDRILILETRYDSKLNSKREYAEMLEKWFSAYGQEVLREKIHTYENVKYFLEKAEVKNAHTRFIHFGCHGGIDETTNKAMIYLTDESICLDENANLFEGRLKDKIVIFSCCGIASDEKTLMNLKRISGAQAIFTYSNGVEDYYTNICEVLIYHQILESPHLSPEKICERLNNGLSEMGLPNKLLKVF